MASFLEEEIVKLQLDLIVLALSLSLSFACSKKKFSGDTPRGTTFKQVNDTTIKFGDQDVFRIGDGTSGINSACAGELQGYDLRGATYYFQFEVLEDDTGIDISIGKICGVDNAAGTTMTLVDSLNAPQQTEIAVPIDSGRAAAWSPYSSFTLAKGTYSLIVRSKNVMGKTGPIQPGADEYDDFIIGSIQVAGQKKVRAVKVYAE